MDKKRFLKVYIEIINICNLNCSFCKKTKRENKIMNLEEFDKICNEVKVYTNLIALHVQGEPLMHPELEGILNICEKHNLKVNITTNATLLNEKLDIILNSKAIRQINCSLHSGEQNQMRVEEYISKVFLAVDEIHKKTNIIISYRLWNLKEIKENEINFKALEMLGKHYNIENIVELAKENLFIECDKNIFLNQDLEFEWPDIEKEVINECGKCYGLRNQLAILADGTVVPCCLDSEGNIKLGNIFEKSLEEILETEKSKNIIEGFKNEILVEELCKKCGFIKKFR